MRGIWMVIALAGCRQIFGISDPQTAVGDAEPTIDVLRTIDGGLVDANTQGEVAHFAFDVIANNKTPDDVGHHDATCSDSTRPFVVGGHRATALQFVSPDYVVIPPLAMSATQAFTIALWVEVIAPPLGTASDCLLYQPQTLSLCVGSNSQVTFATTNNTLGDALVSLHTFMIGTWYHLAVTYDGQTKRIYINGIVDSTDTTTMTSAPGAIDVGALVSSGGNGQPSSYANANLDELAIYSRALAASEIQALANQ
jgi:Concanavalin A-like lectin/glucanases superfamily